MAGTKSSRDKKDHENSTILFRREVERKEKGGKEKTRQLFRKKEQKRERTEWSRGKGRKIFRNGNDERMRERDREAG